MSVTTKIVSKYKVNCEYAFSKKLESLKQARFSSVEEAQTVVEAFMNEWSCDEPIPSMHIEAIHEIVFTRIAPATRYAIEHRNVDWDRWCGYRELGTDLEEAKLHLKDLIVIFHSKYSNPPQLRIKKVSGDTVSYIY